MENQRKSLLFCIIGAVFSLALGTLSHFFYEWSGNQPIVGFFFPVNESTWEHLKLAIFPILLFFAMGSRFLRGNENAVLAAFCAVLIPVLLIPAIFYTYTAFTGAPVLPVDIATFAIAVLAGFAAAWLILRANSIPHASLIGWIGIFVILACYFTFTAFPPHCFLFRDPLSGGYGYPASQILFR